MPFMVGGSSTRSLQPAAAGVDTTDLHFWLQWRVAVCALWVLCCVVAAAYLIWRHEGPGAHRRLDGTGSDGKERRRRRPDGVLYDDEAWRPCLRDIHPAWLLAYRLGSFIALFSLLIVIVISDGGSIFYYYTQWTFILVTIYFGLATAMSIYGCSKFVNWNAIAAATDTELGPYAVHGAVAKPTVDEEDDGTRNIAGFWGYLLQIIYQLLIGMHSVNAVFLLGEASLNSMRFPWFRIAYFFLWTALYVVFQWIVHASTPIWWPYPFLHLSANLAPLW
ncbi:hypothetical protein ACQ4PT_018453 [Festuca glaucescens]